MDHLPGRIRRRLLEGGQFTEKSGAPTPAWPLVDPPQATDPPPPQPYVFGTPAADGGFRNDSMPTWGGNVVEGDDELFHLFAAGFSTTAASGAGRTTAR